MSYVKSLELISSKGAQTSNELQTPDYIIHYQDARRHTHLFIPELNFPPSNFYYSHKQLPDQIAPTLMRRDPNHSVSSTANIRLPQHQPRTTWRVSVLDQHRISWQITQNGPFTHSQSIAVNRNQQCERLKIFSFKTTYLTSSVTYMCTAKLSGPWRSLNTELLTLIKLTVGYKTKFGSQNFGYQIW